VTCARGRGQPPAAGTAAAHAGPGDALCQTPVPARRSQDSACIPLDDGVGQVPEGIRGGVRPSLRSGSMQGLSLWWRAWMGAVVTSSHGPCQSPWMWAVVSTPWRTPEGSRHLRWFIVIKGRSSPAPRLRAAWREREYSSAWMGEVGRWTTFLASGGGGRSKMRRAR
jgi:hypothetical protein